MARQARLLQRLAGHFLDVVAGLPTLKVFGRAKAQVAAIRDITDQYRAATMATLKVAFLSSLILELLATISVALVAVAVGLRLLGGHLSLATALFVLILAPEAYLPLRLLGTNYHASAEGMKAAEDVFEVLEQPLPAAAAIRRDVPDPSRSTPPGRPAGGLLPGPALPALPDVSFDVRSRARWWPWPGPAGAGSRPCSPCCSAWPLRGPDGRPCGEVSLADLDPDAWRAQRRPGCPSARTCSPGRSPRTSASAVPTPPTTPCVPPSPTRASTRWWPDSPTGLDTVLGHDGAGLSAGERQRVALARAFVRRRPPAAPRRAHRQSRRPDRGERAGRRAPADGRAAPWSSWPTGPPCWPWPTGSSTWHRPCAAAS